MTPSNAKVLIVDDEEDLRFLLQRYLASHGFVVRSLADASQLDRALAREPVDLLVLDLMMPGEDGLAVCRRLRAQGETLPILMLTAKGDPIDRIIGLEMGADDYLAKPFDPRELLARLQAMLRRQAMYGVPVAAGGDERIRFGPFELDCGARRLSRDGVELPLGSTDFALLQVLARHPGQALGRERLLSLLRGKAHELSLRAVDVQVLRLRRLIETDPANPRFIRTLRGVGYLFVPHGDA